LRYCGRETSLGGVVWLDWFAHYLAAAGGPARAPREPGADVIELARRSRKRRPSRPIRPGPPRVERRRR
jgi:hypothetical protein